MSVIGSNILAGASGQGGYFIDRSLRFRSSASAYLNRTPASAGNQKTWTWSGWFKKTGLTSGTSYALFGCGANNTNDTICYFHPSGEVSTFDLLVRDSSTVRGRITSYTGLGGSRQFRDSSAWYHFVVVWDSTNATSADRIRLYINGERQSSATGFVITEPPQNTNSLWNSTQLSYIGRGRDDSASYFDGYLTEINFIDGQALDPTYFGEYNDDTGVWQAKKYTGTYGTNGFYLNFSDNTSTTTLGEDGSGNGNDWTTNNISLTSGSTYDSMTDVPTLTSETSANYCTLNPLASPGVGAFTQGNLTFTASTSAWQSAISTIGATSGKWYFEATATAITGSNLVFVGAAKDPFTNYSNYLGSDANTWGVQYGNSSPASIFKYNNGSGSAITTGSIVAGDIIQCAIDLDNGYIWFGKNNTWAEGDPAAGTGASFTNLSGTVHFGVSSVSTGNKLDTNFGQRPFAYTPPTGFKALNTYNLPDSTVKDGSKQFNTVLYTGTGGSQSVTGIGFQPDWVWLKMRNLAGQHYIYDAVRGAPKELYISQTWEEDYVNYGEVTSFNSDGFTVYQSGIGNEVNYLNNTYVSWNWKANGSGVSNTDGSITSTVSANTTAGFSIVTYTGTGSAATIGHGLGVAPKMVMTKSRSNDTGDGFAVYHASLTSANYWLILSSTAGEAGPNSVLWNNTAPTSSVFSVGSASGTNTSTYTYVAYCFAEVEGYSKIGSYTGNGSTTGDGTFVYTGFRPAWVMIKRTDTTASWNISDTTRDPDNPRELVLYADDSLSERDWSLYPADILSNGFKLRTSAGGTNASGGTYIYLAFAENPFKNSLAR